MGRESLRRLGIVLALLLALALPAAARATDSYVALGDSYAAGPLIPNFAEPYGCLKSTNNYANLAAPKLGLPVFRDATCSGAETEDMTEEQDVSPGPNPPQFDRLDSLTRLVSLQVGGNDIGFSSIAEECFSLTPIATPPVGSPCRDKFVVNGEDEVSARIAETAPKVGAVIQGIKARSPLAHVLVVNYPALFPHTGNGCWPQMPVSNQDVAWLRAKQQELNAMVAAQAAANGARLIDWYTASIGHDACKLPAIRWVEPAAPASPAAPVHPNLFGMQAAAKLIDGAW